MCIAYVLYRILKAFDLRVQFNVPNTQTETRGAFYAHIYRVCLYAVL